LRSLNNLQCLSFFGDYGEICRLSLESDGSWRGAWLQFERMPVELIPQRLQPLRSLENRGRVKYVPQQFHYISYAQLVRDCAELARSLPLVREMAGVPRSGLIPASLIALELNLPMISVESLLSPEPLTIPIPRRGYGRRVLDGSVLVVDDTCASGRQVDHLRKRIRQPVQFAAIYVENRPTIAVDFYHSKLPDFAQFYEWTMFHDDTNRFLLTDLDGVLCDDWTGGHEDQHEAGYLDFLNNVSPRRISTIPLNGIVTNRLNRHRPQTEAWLKRHGIQYGKLIMSPYDTFPERDRANDAVNLKTRAYLADSTLRLFVESDDRQAQEIARRTGRPVFSVARNGLV
jgi:orotate phosphoribosyltransferase